MAWIEFLTLCFIFLYMNFTIYISLFVPSIKSWSHLKKNILISLRCPYQTRKIILCVWLVLLNMEGCSTICCSDFPCNLRLCQMWKCAGPKYLQILSYLVLRLAMLALQKTQMGFRVSESLTFSDLLWMKDNWTGSQNSWVLVLALSLTSCVLLDTWIFFYDPGFSPL